MRQSRTPTARAAVTKSVALSDMTSARTTRAKRAQPVTPITRMVVVRLGPMTAASTTSSAMMGMAISVSITLEISKSTQLPKKPATAPTTTPIVTAMPVAISPTSRATRVPKITRLRRSRPR